MSCGIYKIENMINGKMYIGQSINIERRWARHRYATDDFAIHRAIRKYGIENFSFSILEECSEKNLDDKEIYWITKYNSLIPNGYNMIEGGSNGSGLAKGKPVLQFSPQGKFLAEYRSAHVADDITGINYSSICACCRREQKIANGYQWRYKDDAKDIQQVNDFIHKQVGIIQYDINGNKIAEFSSLKEASEKTGISKPIICKVCKGKGKTAGGYRWAYIGEPLSNKVLSKNKRVQQFSLDGVLLREFNSITEASNTFNWARAGINGISKACKTNTKYHNYIWKYKD